MKKRFTRKNENCKQVKHRIYWIEEKRLVFVLIVVVGILEYWNKNKTSKDGNGVNCIRVLKEKRRKQNKTKNETFFFIQQKYTEEEID